MKKVKKVGNSKISFGRRKGGRIRKRYGPKAKRVKKYRSQGR